MSITKVGRVFLSINGNRQALEGTVTIIPSNLQRETKAGPDEVHGYKETPQPPAIEYSGMKKPDIALKDFQDFVDETVTVECNDGSAYILRNAWCVTTPELDAVEGNFTVRFEGKELEESLSGT